MTVGDLGWLSKGLMSRHFASIQGELGSRWEALLSVSDRNLKHIKHCGLSVALLQFQGVYSA